MVYGLSHAVFIGGRRRLPSSKDPKADPYGYSDNQNYREYRLQRAAALCFDFGDRHTLPPSFSARTADACAEYQVHISNHAVYRAFARSSRGLFLHSPKDSVIIPQTGTADAAAESDQNLANIDSLPAASVCRQKYAVLPAVYGRICTGSECVRATPGPDHSK